MTPRIPASSSSHPRWQTLPDPANPDAARTGVERWLEALSDAPPAEEALSRAENVLSDSLGQQFLHSIFGNSPFLSRCAVSDPLFVLDLFENGPTAAFAAVRQKLTENNQEDGNKEALGRVLRKLRKRAALVIAAADITGEWALEEVTAALTDFSTLALRRAVRLLLREAAERGEINLADPADPEISSGLIVLGMGKLGSHELNYSSDIDLILFYDPEAVSSDRPDELQQCFVKVGRGLVTLLSDITEDGYVARVDLRLRPDPSATPVAISIYAAETYYESLGQNWERAAMIKARPIAGDIEAGKEFLSWLTPFIWRKYLDFAAIQDIHSIKRQIYAQHGGANISIPGHNIKLGRGGIREIEFFAQTQQLIWGGRDPSLRIMATCEALRALTTAGHLSENTAQELTESYHYLRQLEHRLQMIDDQQTHSIPTSDEAIAAVATFMGAKSTKDFEAELQTHLRCVETHYAALFEESPSLGASGEIEGNLIFTGVDDDPETLTTIEALGFKSPKVISATVRRWHRGQYHALRSDRTRQLLTELMPAFLTAFGSMPNSDFAFSKFDEALSRLPAGIQLFAMFHAKPELLALVAQVMGTAPRLAEHLGQNPALLESILESDPTEALPSLETLTADCRTALSRAEIFEDQLDASRQWANDERFKIGIRILNSRLPSNDAAAALSDIAEAAITTLQPKVEAEFAHRHGTVRAGEIVILGMGKLGGREMTPTSDLDLVFIYGHDSDAGPSDGDRPLEPDQYYARLSQRIINAITAPTTQGRLYEVDMRLRPSGNAGPVASSLRAFTRYHEEKAWTWERMAMTRARLLGPPSPLADKVRAVISATLGQERDAEQLVTDVVEMRDRIDGERHTDFIWEVKFIRGGIVDIEFLVQYLLLRHGHDHPEIMTTNTRDALIRLKAAKLLPAETADSLLDAYTLWQTIQAMLRLTIEGFFVPEREHEIPTALEDALTKASGEPDLASLKDRMARTAAEIFEIYKTVLTQADQK
ncbi:MAG: bifunctional [glutamine synthetase] adenylyltransferase/[glutamine synthetase]-adenylyl-L-tyrosine phosphorylase [Proteobacteria bacterium]|nr:bifunctional [glutamine synthetase] adenylyltransferase/[glutamine synthetase]-adenylyl-L-tyrosine phosphorylase [Pseudomonadota bacterium]